MTLTLLTTGHVLVGFFSPKKEVVESGFLYLRCVMPFYVPFSIFFCLNGAMRGAGDSLFPFINSVISLILLRVPLVYLLAIV